MDWLRAARSFALFAANWLQCLGIWEAFDGHANDHYCGTWLHLQLAALSRLENAHKLHRNWPPAGRTQSAARRAHLWEARVTVCTATA